MNREGKLGKACQTTKQTAIAAKSEKQKDVYIEADLQKCDNDKSEKLDSWFAIDGGAKLKLSDGFALCHSTSPLSPYSYRHACFQMPFLFPLPSPLPVDQKQTKNYAEAAQTGTCPAVCEPPSDVTRTCWRLCRFVTDNSDGAILSLQVPRITA